MAMFDEKTTSSLEGDEPAVLEGSGDPRDGGLATYTRRDEARVVRKLDWNLMTIFFVLCEFTHVAHYRSEVVDGRKCLHY